MEFLTPSAIFIAFLCNNIFQTSWRLKYFWKKNNSEMKNISFHVKNFLKKSSVIFVGKIRTFLEFLEWNMGYLERNSETWKTPGFSGFECRVSGIGRVSIFGFGSGSGSKKVGLFPRVSGFRVQRPITTPTMRRL